MKLLVGDIGGTNSRLMIYETTDSLDVLTDSSTSSHKIVSQNYYKNNDYKFFEEVLLSFLSLPTNRNVKIHSCCLAVAGPVSGNQINFTNREGWIINGTSIANEFHMNSVLLINDFVANGYGLLTLSKKELVTLQPGKNCNGENLPIALIGAGTGLGECFLTPNIDDEYTAFPTEGGHVEFSPRSPLENELLAFLQGRLGDQTKKDNDLADVLARVSVERIVSGKGLENIYEFLREKYPDQVDANIDHDYNESSERGRLIGSEKYNYKLFKQSLEMMFAVYGGETGNVALKYLPYGGLYVAGGIAPKNIEFINAQDSEFMKRFKEKGRMSSIMKDFPVHIVMMEDLGLRGAHIMACRQARKSLLSQYAE